MDNSPRVAIVEPRDDLVQDLLDIEGSQGRLVLREVLLKIHVDEFKNELQLLLGGSIDNLAQPE